MTGKLVGRPLLLVGPVAAACAAVAVWAVVHAVDRPPVDPASLRGSPELHILYPGAHAVDEGQTREQVLAESYANGSEVQPATAYVDTSIPSGVTGQELLSWYGDRIQARGWQATQLSGYPVPYPAKIYRLGQRLVFVELMDFKNVIHLSVAAIPVGCAALPCMR
ncbi:MAG TPA: hypothetical protein VGQ42_05015 [Candidatus Dormibacteraeota bacterium]|jgi:hypothetical protein|nr:hypothetical protein [Candidatus Dormibacteraeota bacterium]